MGRLNFTQNSETKAWECEVKGVDGAFGINIVMPKKSYVDVMAKDPEAPEYANIRKNGNNNDKAYLEQFVGEIWPLDIKVVCGVEPVFGKIIM